MTLHNDSEEVDRLADMLASVARVSKTEAVRLALANELQRHEASSAEFLERLRPLQERLAAVPSTGLDADKTFYDSLNDE